MRPRGCFFSVLLLIPFSLPAAHGPLPLVFEPGAAGGFVGRNAGGSVSMTPARIELGAIRMRLAGARPQARLEGLDPLPGKSFYYVGNDPRKWRTGVPQYGRVAYRDVYPGVDLIVYGSGAQLEYDLVLAPHADLSRVRLRFDGARGLAVEANGDLRIESRQGALRQKKPLVYQEVDGQRRELAGSYVVAGREVRLAVEGYDPERRLVIDPVIAYATFFGGNADDIPSGLTVDAAGNAYFTGYTSSTNFPTAPAATGSSGKGGTDAFVVKLDPAGQHILYSVVLGGSSYDAAVAVAIDPAGNAYVTGSTASSDFPTRNAYQTYNKGGWDAFVAKLDGSGNLAYSTYLGGGQMQPCHCSNTNYGSPNPMDAGTAIVADASGNAYVAGITYSADFPFTIGIANHSVDWGEAFVAGFGASGNLLFSTLIGGSANDSATAISLGGGGTLWVAGQTSSTDMPVTAGVVQSKFGGSGGHPGQTLDIGDGWVAKVDPTNPQKVIAALTYLGGSMDEQILAIRPDAADNLFVAGHTLSPNFPVTPGAYQTKFGGGSDQGDGFLTKLNATLTSRVFSTYFGGAQDDAIAGIALDSAGRPWVLGATLSPDLTPASLGSNPTALQTGFQGTINLFLMEWNAAGTSPLYFTYMSGGLGPYSGNVSTDVVGLGIDAADHVYCMAIANQPDAAVGPTALQPKVAGGIDVHLMKLDFSNPVSVAEANVAGGAVDLAQNAWIEIYGTGLAPAGTSLTWSSAPDFASGKMPTQLQGVSVTVNGKPAYVYFISPTQVNVLTPLDGATGSVQLRVTNGANTSDPFTVNLKPAAPGFLRFGDYVHIAAEHADYSLLGPASMSSPGYVFTPAKPNETILLFGDGLGLPVSTLTPGSNTQSGALPIWPQITIGGLPATVTWTGLISPGLYQINVAVPAAAANGDNQVVATYGGASSPTGAVIAVAR